MLMITELEKFEGNILITQVNQKIAAVINAYCLENQNNSQVGSVEFVEQNENIPKKCKIKKLTIGN